MAAVNAARDYSKSPKRVKHGPRITEKRFLNAIKGSGGLRSIIAKKLNVSRRTVDNALLKHKKWERCIEAYRAEVEKVADNAESTIQYCITQKADIKTAAATARWYLATKCADRGFKDPSQVEVTVEGGKNPVTILGGIVNLDALALPLDLRRELLAKIEKPIIDVEHVPSVPLLTTTANGNGNGNGHVPPTPAEEIKVKRKMKKVQK